MTTRKAPWEKGRPRRELAFPAVQTPTDLDFVPKKSRDPEEIARLQEQKRAGQVIVRKQRMGITVLQRTFEEGMRELSAGDADQLARFTSEVGLGSAYHLFVQHDADMVGERRVKLPIVQDDSTDERFYRKDLAIITEFWLMAAGLEANAIEKAHRKNRGIEARSRRLGRSLAEAGIYAAVLAERVPQQQGSEEKMQWHAWKAAQDSMRHMLELTNKIGERPTVAALMDSHSNFSQYLYADNEFMPLDVYDLLQDQIRTLQREEAVRTQD